MRKFAIFFGIIALSGLLVYYFYQNMLNLYYGINPMARSSDKQHIYNISNKMNSKQTTYVAMGDSLTAGVGVKKYEQSYPYLLAQYFSRREGITLVNQSVPGYTSGDLINELLDKAIADKPGMVTLLIGTNDILTGVTDLDFEQNYNTILSRLSQETQAKIYVISVPYIGAEEVFEPPYNDHIEQKVQSFNSIIQKVAPLYNAVYIDIFSPTVVKFMKNGSHYSKDNFHPSAEGYAEWAQIIYDATNI